MRSTHTLKENMELKSRQFVKMVAHTMILDCLMMTMIFLTPTLAALQIWTKKSMMTCLSMTLLMMMQELAMVVEQGVVWCS